jgi:hypothetical protein
LLSTGSNTEHVATTKALNESLRYPNGACSLRAVAATVRGSNTDRAGVYTGYGVKTLLGVREAISRRIGARHQLRLV